MKKILMTAAALLLIGAGCSAQTSGGAEVQVPGANVQVEGGGGAGGSGSAGGGAQGGYNY